MSAWARRHPLACLLGAGLAARLLVLALLPVTAISVDFRHWLQVGLILKAHGNPYAVTPYLNWPPLWLQILFGLLKAAAFFQYPFLRLIQLFLIAVDLTLLSLLYAGARRLFPEASLDGPFLWGLALNPILILLACQHGNFDALVAVWVAGFALCLAAYEQKREGADWLLACLFVGLGALTKTAPLILLPLLLPGWRRLGAKHRVLGLVLALGPAALGVSVLYALAPEAVELNVIGYRSQAGYFGLTAIPYLGGLYARLAPLVLAAAAFWAGRAAWRGQGLKPAQAVLAPALLLALVPALGPGYAPQYLAWFLPLLAVSYAADPDPAWRRLLRGLFGVASATYLFEYALFASHGAFLARLWGGSALEGFSDLVSRPGPQALARLPLFLGYALLLRRGLRRVLAP